MLTGFQVSSLTISRYPHGFSSHLSLLNHLRLLLFYLQLLCKMAVNCQFFLIRCYAFKDSLHVESMRNGLFSWLRCYRFIISCFFLLTGISCNIASSLIICLVTYIFWCCFYQDSGFPCFKGGPRTIQNLRKRFHLSLTEEVSVFCLFRINYIRVA